MSALFTRQPIFDRELRVFAYELCHEPAAGTEAGAALQTLVGTVANGTVLSGKQAFLALSGQLVTDELTAGLAADTYVIELEGADAADAEAAEARETLRRQGFRLALDMSGGAARGTDEAAAFVKVNVQATNAAERATLVQAYKSAGIRLVAVEVETPAQYAAAREEGFDYFQGRFFTHPAAGAHAPLAPLKLNVLRLLAEIHRPDFDFGRVGEVLRQDLPLCLRLMRYVNSPAFWYRWPIRTVPHALALLGQHEVCRWAALAALPEFSADKPQELVTCSVLRARFCELLAPHAGLGRRRAEIFLMGLFSLLDVLLDRPLDELLDELRMAHDARDVLLGTAPPHAPLRQLFELMQAFERADWGAARRLAERLGQPLESLQGAYVEALQWTHTIAIEG